MGAPAPRGHRDLTPAPRHRLRGPLHRGRNGFINVIVWPRVLERFRAVVLGASLLYVKGVLQREGEVIHVVAGAFFDESAQLADLP